jgi:hypothetical protein
LRAEHGRKDRPQREQQRACADPDHRERGDATLRAHGVEEEPARHLKGQCGKAAGGQNQSDVDLGPLMGREIDRDERAEPGLYVGDEEREPVERALAPARRPDRRLRWRCPCRSGPRIVGFVPAAFAPASVGFAGFTLCRSDGQGYFSGVAASVDGVVRSGPAGPSTTSGSPRLYSGATLT